MTEAIYSRERHPLMEGRLYRNPRFFDGIEQGVKRVLIDGDYPEITAAYVAAGVPVSRIDPLTVTGPATLLPPHEPGAIVIPEDWRELAWTQKAGEDGTSLRALASAISDAPVTNKADAFEVIEGELARRAAE